MQINVSLKKKTYVTKKWQTTVNKHDKRARTPQDLYINSCKRTTAFVLNQFKSVLNQFKSRSKFAESYKVLPTKLKATPPLSLLLTRYTRRQQSDL